MAGKMSTAEELLIYNNPFYADKYYNSRVLPSNQTSKKAQSQNTSSNTVKKTSSSKTSSKKTSSSSKKSSSSKSTSSASSAAQKEDERLAKEREQAEKERQKAEQERLALLQKQKEGAADIIDKYDSIYSDVYSDSSEAYIDGVKKQRALNELMAQQGLYGSGYSEEKNRETAVNVQNDITDIYNDGVNKASQLEMDRQLEGIPLSMMEKRYTQSSAPKKYVDKIVEQLLKDELKKQIEAQKWADSSEWI